MNPTGRGNNSDPTDIELLRRFEAATLSGDCFHHAEHVRVAFLYLQKYPVVEALQKFTAGLKRLAAALGKPDRYHETVTWAYLFLIHDRMARSPRLQNWEEFARLNPDLLVHKPGVLEGYYAAATLESSLAKRVFLFPERFVR